ncbi:oxidoreductase [Rhodotorula sp. JG-1b]|nr:oxidoreductase [Rhodotorula sp. JG-1b]
MPSSSARKVVLVTGSSAGGIGYALCEEFAARNCIVYASARRLAALETLPASIHRIELDVASFESCQKAVNQVLREQGRIDVLVNNAGAGGAGALLDADVESEEGGKATFEINFWAPLRMSKLVVPHMAQQRSGLIVNIGSIVGNIPTPWTGIYSASKAALHSASETLRMEVAGFGIDVMLVAPGAITSQFGKKQTLSIKLPEADSLYKDVADRIAERSNMSQRADHTMPASKLAEGIVARALRSKPAAYYTAGGKAFLFWLLERIPRPIVWFLLARQLGANQVGQRKQS